MKRTDFQTAGSPKQSIHETLAIWAEQTPVSTAIAAPGRPPLTFGNLYGQIERAVADLRAMGVSCKDRVAGIGAGRGYLNDPERTSEVFLTDPFCDVAGARLYRTGDLVRYLPDGNIEFLGRRDSRQLFRVGRALAIGCSDHFASEP